MKCLQVTAPRQMRIFEREVPAPAEGEALLKVLYGGICGSDLGLYRGSMNDYATYPQIPGHEIAAEILEVGRNSQGFAPGMLVTLNPYFNCGECYSCRRGYVNCCMENQTMGLAREGGFSEYITMPIERLYSGNGLGPRALALVEPFCISYHAVKRGKVGPGDRVLIVGAGTIGMGALLAAKQLGAEVYVCNVSEKKLELAQKLGADGVIFNNDQSTFREKVDALTNGDGFDVTIEAAGQPSTMLNCIEAAAHRGRVVEVGITSRSTELIFNIIEKKELEIYGSRNATAQEFTEVIALACAGKINLETLVTGECTLEEAPAMFERLDKRVGFNLKTLIKF
ncbi:L-galactonate-5-dehydrogenase [bioreactor metagenome]|uniref:L-galactonate-5-dehydrogenase n=1 Tax=bioreactor metagenome TaxID=1076179 RepID=A0A644YUL4_9ZZZZ